MAERIEVLFGLETLDDKAHKIEVPTFPADSMRPLSNHFLPLVDITTITTINYQSNEEHDPKVWQIVVRGRSNTATL